jgi:hypothetical protein
VIQEMYSATQLSQQPARRRDQLISEEVSGECVIYDQRKKKAHHLNSTLTWIWHRCDGNTPVKALSSAFKQEFDASNSLDILFTGLKQLQSRQLLETPVNLPEIATSAKSISRRAMVAAGSALMPAIVSILAPTPAAASSDKEKEDKKIKIK